MLEEFAEFTHTTEITEHFYRAVSSETDSASGMVHGRAVTVYAATEITVTFTRRICRQVSSLDMAHAADPIYMKK